MKTEKARLSIDNDSICLESEKHEYGMNGTVIKME